MNLLTSAMTRTAVCLTLLALSVPATAQQIASSLFDGKTLDGWETIPSDQKWWTINEGLITGGSLTESVPHNTFLATKVSFQNFDLMVKIRIRGGGGFINSGIQMRSIRVPGSSEMSGYQVDAGDGWWGKMYDESRRNIVIAQAADLDKINVAIRPDDWNEYRILADGRRIRSWINGVVALDYTESDGSIATDGHIGIQVHGGGKALVEVKDLSIKRLAEDPFLMTWGRQAQLRSVGEAMQDNAKAEPFTAEEERQSFVVPDGFDVELVASEADGIGKFVAVAFDAAGRMWSMTALEYPVDANENPEASRALFEQGGTDKILVFDEPFGKVVSKPRVFADGLVMPLGILPYKDGVFAQYGGDIRFYRDTDGDGKADRHEVILTGFGTQDSHLFPHQFTRVPGNHILTAQGLFNDSRVRRLDGSAFAGGETEIPFLHCKLARFTPSGSTFEALTAGPNNIWGLTISREGETWIQEANDIGYPIIPYEPGGHYATGSSDRLRPYQPLMPPPMGPPQMGGTGLSGLALADDLDGWPTPWGANQRNDRRQNVAATTNNSRIFYLANPITSRIQMIRATPNGKRYDYEKLSDLLVSKDPKFRPVAIQFGPDGCLYVTDWYNKIISHNEVPRNHPERDKVRGRIWRIRHRGQAHIAPPNLKTLVTNELLSHLGADNARIADMAWQEIVDRGDAGVLPELQRMAADPDAASGKRLGALWAAEGLASVPTKLLQQLAQDKNPNLRHEAVRIAAAQPRSDAEFYSVTAALVDDPSPQVRAALGDALRRVANPGPQVVSLMLRLGKAPIDGDEWDKYDREFERYLARWAMQENAEAIQAFLESDSGKAMPLENRILATLALGGKRAATGLATLLPELQRPVQNEELKTLSTHMDIPVVAKSLGELLQNKGTRVSTLSSFLALRTQLSTTAVEPAIDAASCALWREASDDVSRQLAMRVAGEFKLASLDKAIAAFAEKSETSEPMKLHALRSLRELGSVEFGTLARLSSSESESPAVRDAAFAALSASPTTEAAQAMADLLLDLKFEQRKTAIERMAVSRSGALALLSAIDKGDMAPEDISPATLKTMQTLLPDNELLKKLWSELAGKLQHVLSLSGHAADFAGTPITLDGAFTIETWVRLNGEISQADGILGRAGGMDMNFYASEFRVYIHGKGDVVAAKRKLVPDVWTHIAVTRDKAGFLRIYINGEPASQSSAPHPETMTDLRIGQTTPGNIGTDGSFSEYRVWNFARSEAEIRNNFDRSFVDAERPGGLTHYYHDENWGELSGQAAVTPTLDAPSLLTAKAAKAQDEKFAKFRELAAMKGEPAAGRLTFEKTCLTCHQQGSKGGKVGPALDGVGLTGTEALLRNILTPSAAMEGGYRNYQVLTLAGRVIQGLLVSQDTASVVIRQPNIADQIILKSEIDRAGFTATSVMPTGLLEDMPPQQVSDLFAHLLSLKQGS